MLSRSYRAWISIAGLIVLAACSPATRVAPPTQEAGPIPVDTTPIGQEDVMAAPAATEMEASAPTLLPVKTTLEATDPATVDLAPGGPLLVEFFAFW